MEFHKSQENDQKIFELETLKSNNHVLEDKLRILNQKLENAKKDIIEKDNLIKKMAAISALSDNDFELFHNLTLELQKQATTLHSFQQNAQSFKPQPPKEPRKDPIPQSIAHQTPEKIPEPPIQVNSSGDSQQRNNEAPQKAAEIQPKAFEAKPKITEIQAKAGPPQRKPPEDVFRAEIPVKSLETPENKKEKEEVEHAEIINPIRSVSHDDGKSRSPEEKSPLKEQSIDSNPRPQEESHPSDDNSQLRAEVNRLIEPPPQSFKKKLEEKKNMPASEPHRWRL